MSERKFWSRTEKGGLEVSGGEYRGIINTYLHEHATLGQTSQRSALIYDLNVDTRQHITFRYTSRLVLLEPEGEDASKAVDEIEKLLEDHRIKTEPTIKP